MFFQEFIRKLFKLLILYTLMNSEIRHMQNEIEVIKRDMAVIMHILSEEGELTEEAKKRLAKARKTPLSEYEEL